MKVVFWKAVSMVKLDFDHTNAKKNTDASSRSPFVIFFFFCLIIFFGRFEQLPPPPLQKFLDPRLLFYKPKQDLLKHVKVSTWIRAISDATPRIQENDNNCVFWSKTLSKLCTSLLNVSNITLPLSGNCFHHTMIQVSSMTCSLLGKLYLS